MTIPSPPSAGSRPVLARAIPVELDAVPVRVAEVERLADAVVGRAVEADPGVEQPAQRVGERLAGRVADRGVEEPGRPRRRRRAALALPGVEPDVVVVAAGAQEDRLVAVAHRLLEAEHVAPEAERAVEVGDLEVDVADVHARIDRLTRGHAETVASGRLARAARRCQDQPPPLGGVVAPVFEPPAFPLEI